jgi:hypothetical protein
MREYGLPEPIDFLANYDKYAVMFAIQPWSLQGNTRTH